MGLGEALPGAQVQGVPPPGNVRQVADRTQVHSLYKPHYPDRI